MSLTIGVDVGGTKIAAGVVDEDGTIIERRRRETPAEDESSIVETIVAAAAELAAEYAATAVGIGTAGFIDAGRSHVYFSPNLAFREVDLRRRVESAVGLPVVVENDANAAAWAEFRFGAGKDVDDMMLITVGTGVGGGLVLSGELYRGGHGVGGEIGHTLLVENGQLCGCGLRGCVEAYASGTALEREARSAGRTLASGAERLLAAAGGDADAITGPMITELAKAGDPLSVELIGIVGTWLGRAMGSFTSLVDPTLFVVGGGVGAAGDLLLEPATAALATRITGRGYRPGPSVRPAELGNAAGIVGAADLARR